MNQIEVQIMGQSYLLGCPVGGEVGLREAVGRVDKAMCQIRNAGKIKARDRIAVLAALNMAFEASPSAGAAEPPPAPQAAAASTPASADSVGATSVADSVAAQTPPSAASTAADTAPTGDTADTQALPTEAPQQNRADRPNDDHREVDEQRLLALVAQIDAVLTADGQLL